MASIGDDPRYQSPDLEVLPLPEALLGSPVFLMLEILRAGRRGAEASPEGPQLPRVCVLACLDAYGPQSQRDVAQRLRWDPSDLVAVVDTLERDGLALRRRDPADRRRYALEATADGSVWVREAIADAAGPKTAMLLTALDSDEITALTRLLRRALAGLDARAVAPPSTLVGRRPRGGSGET